MAADCKTKQTFDNGKVHHGLGPLLPALRCHYDYVVLAAVYSPADPSQCYVMLMRDTEYNPYVVCRVDCQDGSLHGGAYVADLRTAYSRFAERLGWVQARYGVEEEEPAAPRHLTTPAPVPRGAPEGLTILEDTEFYGTSRMGGLAPSLTVAQITARLGFRPEHGSADLKTRYRWQFTVNGVLCAVWDYKGERWSYYGPKDTMRAVFAGFAEHDA